jgi:TPR repeat protein
MNIAHRFTKNIFAGLLLGGCAFNVHADLYEDGLMAYAVGNYAEAGQLLISAADQGIAGADQMLMRMFSEGKLYAANLDQETLKWTKKAAEEGYMQAQFALAEIYANKLHDMRAAANWYRKAADQGHPTAYYKLAALLENGAKDVRADAAESTRLYQIAASEFDVFAQKGDADFQNSLAGMYEQGKGVKKNMALAFKWYEKAALQGHALAQLNMGRLYMAGESVARDTLQAAYWLDLAAAQGVREAQVMLSEIKRQNGAELALAM